MSRHVTEEITLSITKEAADMLRAFTKARNGSIHNQADSVIKTGVVQHPDFGDLQ